MQRCLQLGDLSPERTSGFLAGHRRAAPRTGLGDEFFLPGQLYAGRVLDPAMPLVHTPPIRPSQQGGRCGRLGWFQAGHWAEFPASARSVTSSSSSA